MHRQYQAQQRGATPGHVAGELTKAEKNLVHNQIKEALVQATLIKASKKFNHVYPKLCDMVTNLERELDSRILRRQPVNPARNQEAIAPKTAQAGASICAEPRASLHS